MTFGRSCTGVYSIASLAEFVDTFCSVLLPAAALRFYKSKSQFPHEIDFHKEQFLEMIRDSDLPESEKARLREIIESSCDKVLGWTGCKNA
jgi:hypothetical protein